MGINIVILAAGRGTRMKSSSRKVLQNLGGEPLLVHILRTAFQIHPDKVVVVYSGDLQKLKAAVFPHLEDRERCLYWVNQVNLKGTGHAALQALRYLRSLHQSVGSQKEKVLVLLGDVPCIPASELVLLTRKTPERELGIMSLRKEDPKGLGRVIRDAEGEVISIVEEKEATPSQKRVNEVFIGVIFGGLLKLEEWLGKLDCNNCQGEYYLTGIIALASKEGVRVFSTQVSDPLCAQGVNTYQDLVRLERFYQLQQVDRLIDKGVHFADPARFDLRGSLEVGEDVFIDINVVIQGNNKLGSKVKIGAGSVLVNVVVKDYAVIHPYCVIQDTSVDARSEVGPFAHLRDGTYVGPRSRVGNFVEVKRSSIGADSKVKHVAYLGDIELGEKVNFGAGSIVCNYDGRRKHKTRIGKRVFIGSGSQLIAPICVGEDSVIGAGSCVTKDVPPDTLSVSRVKQKLLKRKKIKR